MNEKVYKSGPKSIVMTNNNCSFDLNRSMNNSIITSSYIILKDGTKKRKRHVNSYMEEFLEKRRLAAEFAQSKRSSSSKNPRIRINKNIDNNLDFNNNNINIKKIEEIISINNLKNNLPGKTTALIDNTNIQNNEVILEKNSQENKIDILNKENKNKYSKYINISNYSNNIPNHNNLIINNQNINNNYYISKQNNYNYNIPNNMTSKIIENKYNNIKRHNIVYTKKKGKKLNNSNINTNKNLSNHSFTEDRYSSINHENDEQCNIINTNELNNSNNKDLDLLGPQLPDDAFNENNINKNFIMNSIQNDNFTLENNLENTGQKSLSKDIQNINTFKDISPIKSNNTIQKENNINLLKNNNNISEKKDKENIENKSLNRSDHFLTIMQKIINNKLDENNSSINIQNNILINKSLNLQNSNIINYIINQQTFLNQENSNLNMLLNKNENFENQKDLNLFKKYDLINNKQNINNEENKNMKKLEYEKFLNKKEIIENKRINTDKKDNSSNQDNNSISKVNNYYKEEEFIINNSKEKEIKIKQNIINKNNIISSENLDKSNNINNCNSNIIDIQINKDNNKYENQINEEILNNSNYDKNNILIEDIKIDNINEDSIKNNNIIDKNNNLINSINKYEDKRKFSEEYFVEENEENNIIFTKEDENEEQEKSLNKQEENNINNLEEENNNMNFNEEEENEDLERCEVLKGEEFKEKCKYLKGKNNIITEEILEVEEAQEVNENTSEMGTSKSNRRKYNNNTFTPMIINNFEIKNNINKDYNKIKKDNIIYSISNQNTFIIENKEKENNKYNNLNKIETKDSKEHQNEKKTKEINKLFKDNEEFLDENIFDINNKNKTSHVNNNSISEKNNNNNDIQIKNNLNVLGANGFGNEKEKSIIKTKKSECLDREEYYKENKGIFSNNIIVYKNQKGLENNNNEIINNKNNDDGLINTEKEEKQEFLKLINKNIERLEKIRNNNMQGVKEDESYIYDINNFINVMKEKRKTASNNKIYENKEEIYTSQQNSRDKNNYRNFNNIINNFNTKIEYNNDINNINKIQLNINKSSRLQTLLNDIKKEKNKEKFQLNSFIENQEENISGNFFNEKITNEINMNDKTKINNISTNNEILKDIKLFDEAMLKKIKERNFNNKSRKQLLLIDSGNNKNIQNTYLDKVKEDLMNIRIPKNLGKNEVNNRNRLISGKLIYSNSTNDFDIEIMPANNMNSLYKKNIY